MGREEQADRVSRFFPHISVWGSSLFVVIPPLPPSVAHLAHARTHGRTHSSRTHARHALEGLLVRSLVALVLLVLVCRLQRKGPHQDFQWIIILVFILYMSFFKPKKK